MSDLDDKFNLDLLIKMMKMTTSDNDNIALISLRKANALVAKSGGDWDDILRARVKVTVLADPFAGISTPTRRSDESTNRPVAPRRPQPPPPPYNRPPPPPPQPTPPRPRPNAVPGCCSYCGLFVKLGAGIYTHVDGVRHTTSIDCDAAKAAAKATTNVQPTPPQINRFEGTCSMCRQKVSAGAGICYKKGGKWITEHNVGQCPSIRVRNTRRRGLTSTDDLMN